MPDLAMDAVQEWLRLDEPDKPHLLDLAIRPVEMHAASDQAIRKLGHALDDALDKDPAQVALALGSSPATDAIRAILGQLGVPRVLRIMGWLQSGGVPDAETVVAALLGAGPTGTGLYLEALIAGACHPPLLARLYAPERLAMLQAVVAADDLREAA